MPTISNTFFNRAADHITDNKKRNTPFTRKGASENQDLKIELTDQDCRIKYGQQCSSIKNEIITKLLNKTQLGKNDLKRLSKLLFKETQKLIKQSKSITTKAQHEKKKRFTIRTDKKKIHAINQPVNQYDILLYILREIAPDIRNLQHFTNPFQLNKKYLNPHVAKSLLEKIDDKLWIFNDSQKQSSTSSTWIPNSVIKKLGLDGKDQVLVGSIVKLLYEQYSENFPKIS